MPTERDIEIAHKSDSDEPYAYRSLASPGGSLIIPPEAVASFDADTKVAREVVAELCQARARFADMQSAHEGAAVIQEEYEELWDAVKAHKVIGRTSKLRSDDALKMRREAIQISAMAIRFVRDICDKETYT